MILPEHHALDFCYQPLQNSKAQRLEIPHGWYIMAFSLLAVLLLAESLTFLESLQNLLVVEVLLQTLQYDLSMRVCNLRQLRPLLCLYHYFA